MPCYTRMKTIYLRGLLWLYLLGYVALALEPGFLDFDNLPDTNFSCVGKVIGGYYADVETNCQMFHVCTIGQLDEPMDIRFLCLNGTVFDQETRVCERIDEVDCSKSEKFYSLNLALYGNTQPSIVEETPETDSPIVSKPTTTTTTTPRSITTLKPTVGPKIVSTHHFPIGNRPDIRFNPEEINISLNLDAPPSIRTKPLSFQEQIFASSDSSHNNNKKAIVSTYDELVPNINTQRPSSSSTTIPKTVVSYGLTHEKTPSSVTPADVNYEFTYRQTESGDEEYQTETPSRNYQYHSNLANFRNGQFRNQFRTSTYIPTTRKNTYNSHSGPTTYRSPFKPTYSHNYRTEKPQRLQLPLPLLPTLPPLTFSSPAPFSLTRHIETKRYTHNEHPSPPRIIISASASVSDASGRRLNYSLGTIGVTPLLEETLKSYDDYKDHDVVLDPFYHDVPKVKTRGKRQAPIKHSDVIKSEQEAVDVLKFLFDWYQDHEKSTTVTIPVKPDTITDINDQFDPIMEYSDSLEEPNISEEVTELPESNDNFQDSALFRRKSRFNIVGDVLSVTEKEENVSGSTISEQLEIKNDTEDYIDDNYEKLNYQRMNINRDNTTEEVVIVTTKESDKKNYEEVNRVSEDAKNVTNVEDNETTTTVKPVKNRRRGRLRSFMEEPKEKKEYKGGRRSHGRYITVEYNNKDRKKTPYVNKNHIEQTVEASTNSTTNIDEEITTTARIIATTAEVNNTTLNNTEEVEETTTLYSGLDEGVNISKTESSREEVIDHMEDSDNTTLPEENLETTSAKFVSTEEIPSTPLTTESGMEVNLYTSMIKTDLKGDSLIKTTVPTVIEEVTLIETTTRRLKSRNRNRKKFSRPSKETVTPYTNYMESTVSSTLPLREEESLTTIVPPSSELEIGTTQTVPLETTLSEELETITSNVENLATTASPTTENMEAVNLPTEAQFIISSETPGEEREVIASLPIPSRRRTRPLLHQTTNNNRKLNSRHRFSTELFTSRPSRRRPAIEEEIIEALTHLTTTETAISDPTASTSPSTENSEEVPTTDAPLYRSVHPTQAESMKEVLNTTPLSFKARNDPKLKTFMFNCFGKPIDRFYSDPRDCRLFHYCTNGYTKNQLLDMKFVCDLGTYFDEGRLICTKVKPERCV